MNIPLAIWYLFAPVLTLLFWLGHAWQSWRRPTSIGPLGWLLVVGLPLAFAVTVVVFGLVHEPAPNEVLPRGEIHDWRARLFVLGAELFVAWCVVLALEAVLSAVRSSRRRVLGRGAEVSR